ncbi:MAG: 3-deoxy-manno-octulosonate cytidylyltransferase [Candidatus Omnitrophica bacterium]|nr:3-deoxy-manno-octulosonate cytidylyltransferase [Candidatus Omnitrophota bacterium]
MDVIGVIPARYQSTRLSHKLLRPLCGKPLIQWTWESASKANSLDDILIACDDIKIKEVAEGFGAKCILTSTSHTSGTDRIAEAINSIDAKVIINIQADEPMVHPSIVNELVATMLKNPTLVMATVKKEITDTNEIDDPNVVKVVCSKDGFALYFSRFAVPYIREAPSKYKYHKHLGIYAYNKDFLFAFKNLPESGLEKAEKLEQLRVLEAGYKIRVIETQFDSIGVDVERDLYQIESILKERDAKL